MSNGLHTAVGSICLQCDNKASDYRTMPTVRKRDDLQLMLGGELAPPSRLRVLAACLARPLVLNFDGSSMTGHSGRRLQVRVIR